jgi:carboxyl-terminal processing protease
MDLLFQQYPRREAVQVTLQRPATGRGWTVTMTPGVFKPTGTIVTSSLLQGNIADIRLAGFPANAADLVLEAISHLASGRTLTGVVLDLRGNGGGAPKGVAGLLGAFTHDKVWSYDCDANGACTANHTDDTVNLLHLPLVVLTDRNCASACDAFTGAVKDLRLGPVVGTRTSGLVAGPALGYLLTDNSSLLLPSLHERSANGEIINGIGVAPDYYIPMTAPDLSTKHDPDIGKALTLLGQ